MRELEYPFDSDYILQRKKSIKKSFQDIEGYQEIRVALMSGSTIGEMKNILELFLLNQGFRPVFFEGEYDRFYEELVFPNPALEDFSPQIIYIHTSMRNLMQTPLPGDTKAIADEKLQAEFDYFKAAWEGALGRYHCPVIANNFDPAPLRVLGNRDSYDFGGLQRHILEMNHLMGEFALSQKGFYINDLNYQAAMFGLDRWFDLSKWYLYKYAFSPEAIPMTAFQIANIVKAIYGKNKKALALDLDNTMWGGVIGDDGLEGLDLGIETPEGMAFEAFQDYVKKISMTGVALNLCSKNEMETGLSGFTHPSSRLSAEDFIVRKVNWMNKDKNIHEIAAELNIGEDAIVFVDDNPVERGIVESETLAAVLPVEAPETYAVLLDRSGYFENVGVSEEDAQRNTYFKDNIARAKERNTFADYGEYLKSLSMEGIMTDVGPENIERVTQLTNKTNQFNLTTRRMTLQEVSEYCSAEGSIAFCGRLVDKYGDNGIVSVVFGSGTDAETLNIDLWLMSCRVFKRDLELAMFDELIRRCKVAGVKKLTAVYSRTKKNGLVQDFYESLGFSVIEKDENHGVFEYVIPDSYENKNQVIAIV